MECFWKVIELGNVEVEHDVLGCKECFVHGDIVYCEQSRYNLNCHEYSFLPRRYHTYVRKFVT